MHYVIYRTTNLKNGKWYIGKHKTSNLDDGYIGSGRSLLEDVKQYGRENFTCEILHFLPSEEAMNAKEAELVTEEVVKSDDNYNLCPGGHGGWGYVNTSGLNLLAQTTESREKRSASMKKHHEANPRDPMPDAVRKKIGEASRRNRTFEHGVNAIRGKKRGPMPAITKKKISETLKVRAPDLVCPVCGHHGKGPVMKRWHFANCRK